MRRVLIAAALLSLAACSAPSGIPQPTSASVSDHCAKLFVTDIATVDSKAVGTWDCLAESSREDFFLRLGWSNDASVGHWIATQYSGQSQHVDAYSGNPVTVKDSNGNNRKAYLYRLSVIAADGTWDATAQDSAGLTIVVDSTGRVLEVQ